ncbi:hypothetical protein NEOKW01_0304 [Nematocida sp. AWRm80]|nr:hypothetical protein NEOKW01_0304 [Nematocida sp. AWRm80]
MQETNKRQSIKTSKSSDDRAEFPLKTTKKTLKIVVNLFLLLNELKMSSNTFSTLSRSIELDIQSIEGIGSILADFVYKERYGCIHKKKPVLCKRRHRHFGKIQNVLEWVSANQNTSLQFLNNLSHYCSLWNRMIKYLFTEGWPIAQAYILRMQELQKRPCCSKANSFKCSRKPMTHLNQNYYQIQPHAFSAKTTSAISPFSYSHQPAQIPNEIPPADFAWSSINEILDGVSIDLNTPVSTPSSLFQNSSEQELSSPSDVWKLQYEMYIAKYYDSLNKNGINSFLDPSLESTVTPSSLPCYSHLIVKK